jgi:PAS domain S-box-containing protein
MAQRVREYAWHNTPLGPAEAWPEGLRATVDMLLANRFPMMALWGLDLIQIYNDAYRDIIGLKHPTALGQPTHDCWPELRASRTPNLERVWRGETTGSVDAHHTVTRHGTPEDAWFTDSCSPLRDAKGAVVGILITVLETTEQVRSVAALRASEERFRTLVQNVRDYAIFMLDADGHVSEWSDGAARVLGYGGKAVIGRHASIFYPPEEARGGTPQRELEQARQKGRFESEGWRLRRDGTRFWANEIATAIRDANGTVLGFTKVSRDLSEQKEMQEQREQLLDEATAARAEAEKANRAKDDFLITLSHELRTPLAPILLWGRALRAGMVPEHEVDRAVDAIVLSAESQLQLIEDLRDLSRLKSGRLQLDRRSNSVEAVARAALEVIGPSANAKGVTVELDMPPDLGDAMFDRGRFQQVLWNLLSNAVKFTPEGGRVSLRVRKHAGQLEAVVADTGQGIEAEFLPHLFQRFRQAEMRERRRYAGLGVGLALCRHLVALHGGTVEGHSEGAGHGAVFIVRIPWVAPDLESGGEAADAGSADGATTSLHGLKVLIVEDDPSMRDVMRWTLESVGAGVLTVGSGMEALSVLEAADSSDGGPDVMICDLGLPGMNGYDLIEQVIELRRMLDQKPIPACAVSAHVREVDRERAIDAGFDSYVPKPMTAHRLIEAVAELASVAAADDAMDVGGGE